MSSLVVRVYETAERARDAVGKLKEAGFDADALVELSPRSAQSVPSAIRAGRMLGHRADFFADRVKQGRSLVAVDAPFGKGQLATDIMDGCGPVDQDLEPSEHPQVELDRAAPLSSAFGLPVLTRDEPAPLSKALGVPTLSRSEYYLISELGTQNPAPLSSMFGLRLLSRNPAPLSSLLGLPLLLRWAKSTSFGVKLLSGDPAPLSSAFGIKLLLRDPAPLSSAFGLRLLLRNPTPLSSALGWKVLTRES